MSIEPIIKGLYDLKEKPTAKMLLDTLARHSITYRQYDEVALGYFRIKDYLTAIKYGEKALIAAHSNQEMFAARTNLINLYNHANYPEKAMDLIRLIDITHPNNVDNQLEKAFSLYLLNRKDEAEAIIRHQLETNNQLDEETRTKLRFNLGTYELYRDEFQTGMRHFLYDGRQMGLWQKQTLPLKRWEGELIPNLPLVVLAEAGIGDEFINVRFINHLKQRQLNPMWYTDRDDLRSIFVKNGYTAIDRKMVDQLRFAGGYQWVHSMDLPVLLNLQYQDLWNGPYLKPTKTITIPSSNNIKIGVRWQGNPEYDQDLHRSIPFAEIYEAIKAANIPVALYSLQRDTGLDQLNGFDDIVDLSPLMGDYEDTLAMIDQLNLIITSCTSIAHAAAAIGKQTIVITPISAYYTWSHSSKQSPWYGDNVTLLRQQRPRVWDQPLKQLTQHLIENYSLTFPNQT